MIETITWKVISRHKLQSWWRDDRYSKLWCISGTILPWNAKELGSIARQRTPLLFFVLFLRKIDEQIPYMVYWAGCDAFIKRFLIDPAIM